MSGSIGSASAHHINSNEILAWVEVHSGQMGKQVQNEVEGATKRVDQLKKLTEFKGDLSYAMKTCDYSPLIRKMDAFLAANKDAPNHDDLELHIGGIKRALENAVNNIVACSEQGDSTAIESWQNAVQVNGTDWLQLIGDVSEGLKKDDQLGMNSLMDSNSQLNQGYQQASNVLQGMHSSSMAVLGNVKA